MAQELVGGAPLQHTLGENLASPNMIITRKRMLSSHYALRGLSDPISFAPFTQLDVV
jgi:hypothetical protein